MQQRPLVDPLSWVQETVCGSETNFCAQERSLWELFSVWSHLQSFPKSSYCKIPNCHTKHLTFLHPKVPDRYIGNPPSNENTKGNRRPAEVNNGNVNNAYVNSDSCCDLIGAGLSTIVLPIVPVTVKASGSDASVLTYAFLDGGSNITFCTINLWKS